AVLVDGEGVPTARHHRATRLGGDGGAHVHAEARPRVGSDDLALADVAAGEAPVDRDAEADADADVAERDAELGEDPEQTAGSVPGGGGARGELEARRRREAGAAAADAAREVPVGAHVADLAGLRVEVGRDAPATFELAADEGGRDEGDGDAEGERERLEAGA